MSKHFIGAVCLFFLCFGTSSKAQKSENGYNDSLKIQLLKEYTKWSFNYGSQKQFDSANKYSGRALNLEKEVKNAELSAFVFYNHARILYWQTNTKEAHEFLNKNFINSLIVDSTKVKSHLLKSEILLYEQRHKESLEEAIIAQKILSSHKVLTPKDSLYLGDASSLMAVCQKESANAQQALFHYDEALKYYSNPGLKTYVKFYKAEILKTQGNVRQSIKLVKESLKTAQEKKLNIYIPTYYLALSEYYLQLKKPDSALFFSRGGLRDNVDCHIDGLLHNAGLSYLGLNDYASAISFFKTALDTPISEIPKVTIHKHLSEAYKGAGKYSQALAHHTIYAKLQDSINDANAKQEIFEISEKYQSEKKTLEIDMLQIKNKSNQEVIAKQKWVLLFVSMSLLLALMLSGLILTYYLKQKKQRVLLFDKNLKLAQKLKWVEMKNDQSVKVGKKTLPTMDTQKRDSIIMKIEKGIKEQFYLNKNITLVSFAKEVDTNTTYLSKIVNEKFHKPFTHFVNDLRIQFMLQKIENEDEYRMFTIDYISDDIGFSSNSAFYTAFKKYTGLTPSYYIKKRKNVGK